ncbi:MAG: Fic family protein [Gammaproteobacteria bacterium]|nr:Fic family protein [Gammaproteobacteria bacterium]
MHSWQHPQWPDFRYDLDASRSSRESFFEKSDQLGGAEWSLDAEAAAEARIETMLSDALSSNAIEGENLDRDTVRSSLLVHMGQLSEPIRHSRKADGAAALMVDVRKTWDQPLTRAALEKWCSMALPVEYSGSSAREYRTHEVRIVSGYHGREKIHFTAPPPGEVERQMDMFLEWFNSISIDSPEKAAVAHFWFETIHPFADGNGRVGRAIADKALSRIAGRPSLACMSTAIYQSRREYYKAFESISPQRNQPLDMTPFTSYFTRTASRAQSIAIEQVRFILDKARFYQKHPSMNPRQAKVVERMFRAGSGGFEGGMSTKKYAAIAKCPTVTASRDLSALARIGALIPSGEGRGRRYALALTNRAGPLPKRRRA